jgi:hypothetical protein
LVTRRLKTGPWELTVGVVERGLQLAVDPELSVVLRQHDAQREGRVGEGVVEVLLRPDSGAFLGSIFRNKIGQKKFLKITENGRNIGHF